MFDVDRVRFRPPSGGDPRDYFVLDAPDWINVIPLTEDRQVVLVRQFRFGVERVTLEIPGGMCDPGESPEDAARRELAEETGYRARELRRLGTVEPNPAIQSNHCHTFLAAGAYPAGAPRPDPGEELELTTVPLDAIGGLIADGSITHSLVVSAFKLLDVRKLER